MPPNHQPSTEQRQIFSVTEINQLASNTLEQQYSKVWVEGEISDLIQHRSGHWYLTLKDESSIVRAAMFKFQNQKVAFTPKNGDKIQVSGKLSVYAARGSYQLIVQSMQAAGTGALLQRFHALKEELNAAGWFDQRNKQPIPELPRQIAVITSPQGAALHDICTTFARRDPSVRLVLVPVAVQGEGASTQIANAVSRVNQLAKTLGDAFNPDAIIVARGGGSLEDLWAFNEKNLARAIHSSDIPVVSAVGHETDVSIADMVADVRAATPTSAAELLSADRAQILEHINQLKSRLERCTRNIVSQKAAQHRQMKSRLRSPLRDIESQTQTLDYLHNRIFAATKGLVANIERQNHSVALRLLSSNPETKIINLNNQLRDARKQLVLSAEKQFSNKRQRFEKLMESLHLVSPLATLSRGYTITYNQSLEPQHTVQNLNIGDELLTHLSDGKVWSKVTSIE